MGCPPTNDNDTPEVVESTSVECPANPETFGKDISAFANEQVPEFVRQNHPSFVNYLEAYGEFLELCENPVGRITHFHDYYDVDWTTDEFFYLFKQTYLAPFPESFLADRTLVVKRVKDFYAAKGSIESFRVLFRILYGDEITVKLPKEFILRASDGTWQRDIKLYVQANLINRG